MTTATEKPIRDNHAMTTPTLRLRSTAWAVTLCVVAACAPAQNDSNGAAPPASPDSESSDTKTATLDHAFFDNVLKTYVDDEGMVDYTGLKANRDGLDAYIAALGTLPRSEYDTWSENDQLAFWFNAYNAITLQRIINHYPIKKGGFISGLRFPDNSIRQIDGVWDEITTPVMGKEMTLDNIEHDTLRVEFEEPRLHAALVCAAMGCPPLRNEAYRGESLDEQLDDNSRAFLSDSDRFRVDRDKNRVYLSSILKWYGDDFVGVYNTGGEITGHGETNNAVLAYAARYAPEADRDYLLNGEYRVDFLDYDWSLNEQAK